MKQKLTKEDKRIQTGLFKAFAETAFAAGWISENELRDRKTLVEAVQRLVRKSGKVSLIVDHRPEILKEAMALRKRGKHEYAKVFYAMYFEHSINLVVHSECVRRDIAASTQHEVIQQVTIHGKFTWLSMLLGMKPFSRVHCGTIKKLCDDRNGFVHYKWKPDPKDDELIDFDREKAEQDREYSRIGAALAYMKRFERDHMFKGKRRKISKLFA